MKKTVIIGASVLVLILLSVMNTLSRQTARAVLSGPYLGQKPPGLAPEIFAPGIVSKEGDQGRLFIAGDGAEIIYWEREPDGRMRILSILQKNGVWPGPEVLPGRGGRLGAAGQSGERRQHGGGGSRRLLLSRREILVFFRAGDVYWVSSEVAAQAKVKHEWALFLRTDAFAGDPVKVVGQ